eukprot:1181312-Prorocentrum_minimum.AAC.6
MLFILEVICDGEDIKSKEKGGTKNATKAEAFISRLTSSITDDIQQLMPERDEEDDSEPPCLQGSMSEAYERTKQALIRVIDAIDSERTRNTSLSQAMSEHLEEAVQHQVANPLLFPPFWWTQMWTQASMQITFSRVNLTR